ncbi:MAG TPA: tetratricopeptide repeat protein [Kofleriaceae bacterium]|nr:tetratricopeptide repeat protein [Kofleriaceae bacterium]
MRRAVALAGGALSLWFLAGTAHADLKSAQNRFVHGDYKGAEADLKRLSGKQGELGKVVLARLQLRTGRYAEAEKLARGLTRSSDAQVAGDGRVLLAEILRATGRYAEARREIEPLVARQPNLRRGRYVLGLIYSDLGDPRAEQEWKLFLKEFDGNKLDLNDPQTLFYLAEAARYTADFEFANGTYREAVDRDKTLHEANIEWGYLFLDKYAPADAEQSFDEVLKVDPRHPDAHAGMAAVKLEPSYDLAAASAHLTRALEVNPRHAPSLLLRAGIEIDQNQWQKAVATLGEVFAVNPQDLEARSLLATIHWLRDDTRAYDAEKKKVFAINPGFARLYHVVARSAVREHRYREAIELEKQAVALRPAYYEAMEAIGAGYLRLGMEKEGLEWLRKAWKGDQYNMRTKNTLDLFEDYIPREYSFASSKSFKLRYHNDEKPLYRRYIEPLLEQAFADMVGRYGFQPKTPVVIELFQNADHYSVRTIGLPNLGALGICFGQVITAMSPSVGDINWAMVLWHELSHVFAIQLSNSRVPRWFTEGLSEYETVLARPEWRRENDADVYAAMADGVLPSIGELNYGFMKPNMQEVMVAYHLSSLAIEYLARTYGFGKIVAALKLYGQGLETPAVLERVTAKRLADLDADFRKYLEVRLAPYKGSFVVPTLKRGLKEQARSAAAAPKDPHAQSRLALAHFEEGEARPAAAAADRALALDPRNRLALYVKAELAWRDGDRKRAEDSYSALIAAGADSFDIRSRLALIASSKGDEATAEKHLCTAKKLDPERAYPYQALSEIYMKTGRKEQGLRELETYVTLEQMQFAPVKTLVEEYSALKKWDKVRSFGEQAIEINPADTDILLALGQAYLETGTPDRALFSFDSALLVRPDMRRPGLAHLGRARALKAKGDRRAALKAIDQALRLERDNADAVSLKKSLRAR